MKKQSHSLNPFHALPISLYAMMIFRLLVYYWPHKITNWLIKKQSNNRATELKNERKRRRNEHIKKFGFHLVENMIWVQHFFFCCSFFFSLKSYSFFCNTFCFYHIFLIRSVASTIEVVCMYASMNWLTDKGLGNGFFFSWLRFYLVHIECWYNFCYWFSYFDNFFSAA